MDVLGPYLESPSLTCQVEELHCKNGSCFGKPDVSMHYIIRQSLDVTAVGRNVRLALAFLDNTSWSPGEQKS